jgi:hypothetical protein
MELPTYFDDFRENTQPTKTQREVMAQEHKRLREGLSQAPELKEVLLSTFLQGSQRRATANKGDKEHPCDVDVVAVTKLPRSRFTAEYAHQVFRPFLERTYKGRYEAQDRSWCIRVHPEVTMDLVPTSEPDSVELAEAIRSKSLAGWSPLMEGKSLDEAIAAEADVVASWDRTSPLWIPDRTLKLWERTHPLFQISWTSQKNKRCNGWFTHVVKAIKWWKRDRATTPKYPKGYPLEHLVGDCCPDGITSVATGLTLTLEKIVTRYSDEARRGVTPFVQSRGIDESQNVMKRVEGTDFAAFYANVTTAARLARRALDADDLVRSADLWRELLGDEFPKPPADTARVAAGAGFTPRKESTTLEQGRYA